MKRSDLNKLIKEELENFSKNEAIDDIKEEDDMEPVDDLGGDLEGDLEGGEDAESILQGFYDTLKGYYEGDGGLEGDMDMDLDIEDDLAESKEDIDEATDDLDESKEEVTEATDDLDESKEDIDEAEEIDENKEQPLSECFVNRFAKLANING